MLLRPPLLLLLLFTALAITAHAEPMLKDKSLELKPDGIFTYHGDTFSTGLMDPEYHAISQKGMNPEKGYPQTAAGKWTIKGEVGAASGSPAFDLSETLGADGDDALRADFHVQKSDQKPYKVIQLEISVPAATAAGRTLTTDGAALTLPKDPARNTLLYKSGVKKLVLPAHDGSLVVEGNFTVELQDERQWQGDSFQARLVILDSHATANAGDLSVSLRAEPFRSTPISLAAQANRGFRDEVADDHKGGWTDQGPENDMSPLPVGPLAASAVPFRIVDPAANGGKSCLVLSQAKEELFHTVDLPVPGNPMLANLYLLHGAAWVPKSNEKVGVIRARYADGTSQEFEVRCQRDVGDWWSGASLPNAVLGWTGHNQSADVGLFVSKFPLDRSKGLASVQLESTDPALWMVVALTGSPDDIPLASDVPLTIHAGPNWASYPLKYQIEPGSVFDFASLNDAPAGKYGPLIATPGGHFEFAGRPGVPARFWGVNLTFGANFLDKEAADALADQLARSGYNTVRFHHFDGVLTAAGRSYDIDPAPLDKLDYLFAAMKKRGLYLNIDLFTIRKFMKDGLPDYVKEATNIKTVFPINDAALDSWEKYTRNLLTHRNPYTGLTWGEDPALIGICPVNEDPLYTTMEKASDEIKKIYRDKFMQWADTNHVPLPDNAARNQAYNHFLGQLQIENDAHMASFVRSLKVNTLLTGVNCGTTEAQAYPRARYDYVDNHTYLDHPTFLEKSWQLPTSLRQADPLVARGGVIRDLMSDRIFGKPYTVTELHFCWPNRYRSTEGVLTAGYASLQDWDAVYNFDYAGATTDVSAPRGANFFHLVTDPIELLADRAAAVIFRRGDILPAKNAVAFAVNETKAYSGGWGSPKEYPSDFQLLGLVTRIGSLTADPDKILASEAARRTGVTTVVGDGIEPAPGRYPVNSKLGHQLVQSGVIPPTAMDADASRFTSETGQIELSSKPGMMKVVTDRCELFSLPPGERSQGKLVSVENGPTFGSAYIMSADGKTLAQSDRLLVMFLTDSLNIDTAFKNSQATILENYGTMQTLVKRGSAKVRLQLPGAWQSWTVDANGTRGKTAMLTSENGAQVLTAETITDGAGSLAWELTRTK